MNKTADLIKLEIAIDYFSSSIRFQKRAIEREQDPYTKKKLEVGLKYLERELELIRSDIDYIKKI